MVHARAVIVSFAILFPHEESVLRSSHQHGVWCPLPGDHSAFCIWSVLVG